MTISTASSKKDAFGNLAQGTRGDGRVKPTFFSSVLKMIGQKFLVAIAAEPEPRVWQRTNRKGEVWWQGYDPATGCSVFLTSEAEMRVWLEERYHAKSRQLRQH